MKTINKVTIVGALGQDPEARYTPGGMAIVTFSVATNSNKKEQSGEFKKVTQWHNCVCFGKLGEIAEKYLSKGSKIYAEGEIEYQQWDSEGVTKKATKIVLKELSMLSGAKHNQQDDSKKDVVNDSLNDDIPF